MKEELEKRTALDIRKAISKFIKTYKDIYNISFPVNERV